ncbi:MAG: glycosyltransferase, partial [Thermoanaerobaculia bacterium]
LLEAMGQGCVPFGTKIESGTPQLIRHGENGFMAPVGDIEGFARLLESFAASPGARARISKEAWKTVSDSYTVETMTQRYMEVFEKIEVEIENGSFRRSGSISRMRTSIRERVMAPLSVLHPAIRARRK